MAQVVVTSAWPWGPGISCARNRPPQPVTKSEWASGNCVISAALASTAQGQGTEPRLSLRPKNIAMIIANTPAAKTV